MTTVEFVTALPGMEHLAAPVPGNRVKPDWFRDAPVDVGQDQETGLPIRGMKACPGITDYLAMGYVIPAWADMAITRRLGPEGDMYSLKASLPPAEMSTGLFSEMLMQMPTEANESRYAVKLEAPWLVRTEPGWSCLILPLAYGRDQPFEVMPGILDTDVMHQIHFVARMRFEGTKLIELGQPLLHLVPFRREPMTHTLTEDPDLHQRLHAAGKGAPGRDGDRMVPNAYRRWRREFREQHGLD